MIIIHAMNDRLLPRLVDRALAERLRVMPAVVVTGARQTGKTTLVRELSPGARTYFSLDDLDVADLARRDPEALLGGSRPVTLDEVQREPGLLGAVKRAVDRKRGPGRFLLTGSANLLLMRKISETLAGRASYLTLWPMTRGEQLGEGRCGFWEELVTASEEDWLEIIASHHGEPEDWKALAGRGGFPVPALEIGKASDRSIWFQGYVRTYLERDLLEISAITALPDFRRLMRGACLRLGQVVNQTELGRDVGLPQPTVHRYLNLLETSYILVRLPAFSVNRTKRLIKSRKFYWCDTGLALYLAEGTAPGGPHLENLVLCDLMAWRDGGSEQIGLFYWRTVQGEEVDFVIERGGRFFPIEVKASSRPTLGDARHLAAFQKEYGQSAGPGLLLHTGKTLKWITPRVLAAPWWRIL